MLTSVAYAVGPKYLSFHNSSFASRYFFKMLTSVACARWPKCYHVLNWFFFSFQNLVFFGEFIWIFSKQKSLKNQYLPHFESQILPNKFPLNPVHRDLSNDNNNTKGTLQFFWKSSATTYTSNFQSRNHSIFKNFCPASPNSMKPSQLWNHTHIGINYYDKRRMGEESLQSSPTTFKEIGGGLFFFGKKIRRRRTSKSQVW